MKMVVTVTMNPAIDKSAQIDHVIAERKLYCHSPRFEPGGGGINVSRAIRKLGGDSTTIYPAGGPSGVLLRQLLEEEGLDQQTVPVAGWTRENLVIFEETTGQQFRFGMPGSLMRENEWQQCLDAIAGLACNGGYIVASGSLPEGVPVDFYAQVARIGRMAGARVIVDATGEPLRMALDEGVFLIKPNQREFREFISREIRDETELREAALELVQIGKCEVVVVSLGAAGILMVSREVSERVQAPAVPISSKVGAGDSSVAGIVLSLSRGATLCDAIRFGAAAGAAAVMTPGSELCRREDAERLYWKMLELRQGCQ